MYLYNKLIRIAAVALLSRLTSQYKPHVTYHSYDQKVRILSSFGFVIIKVIKMSEIDFAAFDEYV